MQRGVHKGEASVMQLGELVARAAAQAPNKTAILFKDQQMTYGELNAKVNKVANGLKQLGVKFLTEPFNNQGNRLVFFTDGDGNILHLIQRERPLP